MMLVRLLKLAYFMFVALLLIMLNSVAQALLYRSKPRINSWGSIPAIIIARCNTLERLHTINKPHLLSQFKLYCMITAGSSLTSQGTSEADKEWDLRGLKKEVERHNLRLFKKVVKAQERLSKDESLYNSIMTKNNPSLEELEQCPNPEMSRKEVQELQIKLKAVQDLENDLKSVQSIKDTMFESLIPTIMDLNITDSSPPKPERGPKKVKSASTGPRKPYFTYLSIDGVEIRVGRSASDNDELSCDPRLRDNNEWWMHVSGFPGSHIVIRYTGEDIFEKYKETVLDAATLAVVNSKCSQSGKVTVSMTRCRNVSKPRGAKPGLVYLNGDITPIRIDAKAEKDRISRLQKID